MRLLFRGRAQVICRGKDMRAAVRPVNGMLDRRRYGEYVQDMLRLLLPCDAAIRPGDTLTVSGAPYVCVRTRVFAGHVQCDVRRRSA